MTTRRLATVLISATALLGATTVRAQGQPYQPPPPGAQPVYAPPPAPAPTGYPPAPAYSAPVAPAAPERAIPNNEEKGTDHDSVIGHWGFEAWSPISGLLANTPQVGCTLMGPCPVPFNVAGARLWTTRNMAFNVDLALSIGGGGRGSSTSDTYFGVGPAGGVAFLLGNWKHMAVSFAPQGAFVFFTPGGTNAKTSVLFNARFMMEGEVHLGFIGLPGVSLALNTGLIFNFFNMTDTYKAWNFSMGGANSFLGALGSGAYLRFYM